MKKACSAVLLVLTMFLLRTVAFADIAPLPNNQIYKEQRLHDILHSPILPIVIIIVIVAVVVLIRIIRSKKK